MNEVVIMKNKKTNYDSHDGADLWLQEDEKFTAVCCRREIDMDEATRNHGHCDEHFKEGSKNY
jgi:hypothetical protein